MLRSKLINVTASLLLIREVLLNDVVGLHVDLLVCIVLAIVYLLHTTGLFDEQSITVDTGIAGLGCLLVHLTDLENVLQAVEGNLNNLVVRASKKVTERLDTSLRDKVTDLIRFLQTTRGSVGNCPASLLTGLKVTVGKQVDQWRNDASVDNSLDLGGVTSSNVGDGPASLLANAVLGGAQKREEGRERTTVDDHLSLDVIASHNVSNRAQGGGLNGGRCMHKKFHQAARNACFNNSLDLIIGTIRQVGNSPASIDKDLVIQHINKFGKDGESRSDL